MKKPVAIILAGIVGFAIVYLYVQKRIGSMATVLAQNETQLQELNEALDTMQGGLPEIQAQVEKSRDSLARSREVFAQIGQFLKPKELETLTLAYQHAEGDLTLSSSHLTVSGQILETLQTIQSLLQENQTALRALFAGKTPDRDPGALRRDVEERFKRTDDLMKKCDMITEDLGKFVLMQEQYWLSTQGQVENLESAAANDPDYTERFRAMNLLLELSGTAIDHVRKVHGFFENVSKKQKDIERTQAGLLSAGG